MNLLPISSTREAIFECIAANGFLQDITMKEDDSIKAVIEQINTRIRAWNKSKEIVFDVPYYCLENCKDIYSVLIEISDIQIACIAKLISEFSAMAYSGCYQCGEKRVFSCQCVYCTKLICTNCINDELYLETRTNICNGCAIVIRSLYDY